MDRCCICLEDFIENMSDNFSNSVVLTKNCSCRVKLHAECLKKLEENGMDCPICRHKKIIIHNNNINNYIMPFEIFIDTSFAVFIHNTNIFTFMLMFSYTMIVGILFYFPILFLYILCYSRPFRYSFIFIIGGLYLYYK